MKQKANSSAHSKHILHYHLVWCGHLWSPSYYVCIVGGAPLKTIKQYVESQRGDK